MFGTAAEKSGSYIEECAKQHWSELAETSDLGAPGCATRSYLYVEDVAEAFDVILHRGVTGEVWLLLALAM